MKRFLLFFLTLVITYSAYTQCTPDAALTHSGFSPNPLPDGKAGVAYNQTISFQFPTDTTIIVFGTPSTIHVDTLILQSIDGFPASFAKTCNAPNCKYYTSPLRGCMSVSGTPHMPDTGAKKLIISVIVKFKLGGITPIAYPIVDSSQVFRVLTNTGIGRGQSNFVFGIEQITPNPFTEKTLVTIVSPKAEKTTIAIRDILGKEVYSQEVSCKPGSNDFTIDTENFKAGYYLLSVTSSSGVITKKITKR